MRPGVKGRVSTHIQNPAYLRLLMRALRSYDSSTPLEGGRCSTPGWTLQEKMRSTKKVCTISIRSFQQLIMLPTLGPSLGNYLIHSSADIAAISDNGTTYVYHYAAPVPPKHRELSITTPPGISIQDNSTGAQGIHELKISGPPGAEVFSLSGPILSSPKLESPYQPLTASKSSPKNTTDAQIHLFWTEKMNGSTNFAFAVSNNNSGHSQLWEVSRRLKEGSGWLIKREIPLGTED